MTDEISISSEYSNSFAPVVEKYSGTIMFRKQYDNRKHFWPIE